MAATNSMVVGHLRVLSSSTCIRAQKDSIAALSKRSPTVPNEPSRAPPPHVLPKAPGRELTTVVGVQNRWATPRSVVDGHVDGIVDQGSVGSGGEGAGHDHAREAVQDRATVDLAITRGVFGDV